MTKALLALVHHLLVVPLGALLRIWRDPLDRAWRPDRATYFVRAGEEREWGAGVAGRRAQ